MMKQETSNRVDGLRLYWSADSGICELCGKEFPGRVPEADMYNPDGDDGSVICHTACGLKRKWVVA
jgi:hypothetical protein